MVPHVICDAFVATYGIEKCKVSVTKTASENASIRAENSDEMAFFILSCPRFLLFPMSKHSFYHVKAALLPAQSYALTC